MGGSGISSDTCDRSRKERLIARSAPPALSLSRVQNSKNSLFCSLIPRTKTGMARGIRAHRRRSRSFFGKAWRRFGIRNNTQIAPAPNSRVITNDNYGVRHHAEPGHELCACVRKSPWGGFFRRRVLKGCIGHGFAPTDEGVEHVRSTRLSSLTNGTTRRSAVLPLCTLSMASYPNRDSDALGPDARRGLLSMATIVKSCSEPGQIFQANRSGDTTTSHSRAQKAKRQVILVIASDIRHISA